MTAPDPWTPDDLDAGAQLPVTYTERHMLDAIWKRYDKVSQGDSIRYVVAEHVRSDAGFNARRTCDAVVQDLWPAQGLSLHGHEVKVSRSDWLRELTDATKAAEFQRYCDYWWLVVPTVEIVKAGELPAGWGLMAINGAGFLTVRRPAARNECATVPVGFRASLLRSVAKTYARRAVTDARFTGIR